MRPGLYPIYPMLLIVTACSPTQTREISWEASTAVRARSELEKWHEAAERAEKRAHFEECRAAVREIQATVMDRLVDCKVAQAAVTECQANKTKSGAEGMAWGCMFGALLGPLALLGCVGGGLIGESGHECAVTTCPTEPTAVLRTLLEERHLSAPPQCGGQIGVALATTSESAVVVPIKALVKDSVATELGLMVGDQLVDIQGVQATDGERITESVRRARAAGIATVRALRGGTPRLFRGPMHGAEQLGVMYDESSMGAVTSVTVAEVEDGGAAARVGIRPGDILVSIDGVEVWDQLAARAVLQLTPPGTTVRVVLQRQKLEHNVSLNLAARSAQKWL